MNPTSERDLIFHDLVAQTLEKNHTKARSREEEKCKTDEPSHAFLRTFVSSCETSSIRNRLLCLTADSPDLLAVIKEEGRV